MTDKKEKQIVRTLQGVERTRERNALPELSDVRVGITFSIRFGKRNSGKCYAVFIFGAFSRSKFERIGQCVNETEKSLQTKKEKGRCDFHACGGTGKVYERKIRRMK